MSNDQPKQRKTGSEMQAERALLEQGRMGLTQAEYDAYKARQHSRTWNPMTALDRLPPIR
jgi:hypothetical protein